MLKLLAILLIGLVFESTGIVYLKKGMDKLTKPETITVSSVARLLKDGVTSPQIVLGVFFQALFFGCLLALMSKTDISFLWPLTALSFVFTTFSAMWFLGETVSPMRWVGVVFILIGAAFISYSEHLKKQNSPPPTAAVVSKTTPE
jgi:drug/metabolite transporter (DMT)-like permease